MVGESTGGHVWLERLTDDANVWLTAVRMEELGAFQRAASLYLEDAAKCFDEGTVVRAALGATCAADCIASLGFAQRARRLRHLAGVAYWDNADARMGNSVRESLWSLQQSYECFVLSGEEENASKVRSVYDSLARRANPFIGERDSFKLPEDEELAANLSDLGEAPGAGIEPPDLIERFDAVLVARAKQIERDGSARSFWRAVPDPEMETIDAQGFVGQLG